MSTINCPCQSHPSALAFFQHRDSGSCPFNAPEGPNYVHWALTTRAPSRQEQERQEAARARIEALKANPEYQEHAKAKAEARKALKARQNALKPRKRRNR